MGGLTLREALEEYRTIYMPYRNFAERTREEYTNDLQDFIEFAEKAGITNVKEVSISIIQRFIASLEHRGYSSLTRKRKVVCIRSFLGYLYESSYILPNISKGIVLPYTEQNTPHVLTQTECNQLRAACSSNKRDKAIIYLLLATGITLSEITRLTINDIDLGKLDGAGNKQLGFIRVLAKRTKKERMIPSDGETNAALEDYLEVRGNAENNILFLNRFSKPISDRGIQKILRKYLKLAGIGNASVHTLRHTFGANNLAKGISPKILKDLMGVRESRSTRIYLTLAT